ncbi:cytochrome ubiquinol oxidase subunit I [Acidithiobacillus caldus]|jgi:cytochrome d ubiquinol oxidase subunit I|uniref:Cytochrome d ubiquinol oxidase subunit I n=2 Tax=Acidithiobacillus caldus TaxID=33059 RepID=F9ZRD1_ACICS|nr:cytochrome ubiquinol oxidase subunit I [Acidithiobacillus caldus]AEK58929.1 Cytochrome d ubiquinol oxidase subunit I [Acidithiobacillus caldus SM-1]AUW33335.1 cytochrome bd-I ubiquinol oxidase subunit CydA [Acidithiobacillus caldus]MBU2762905.1 cytochrome bd-I ubiquinol oxidase subunit CydA [Acidithiobacillus caldus]MBU2772020.1 cytochrome bd-I ubiquinol oxidase subunit CydA [Acidithiobacillus caldus]MBU2782200.1 cytochrome bd-I ubiquinol oxidase subunit CydA [Acidithiobacillus caldus]
MDMLINPTVVELSRAQFALTALYHFLFVPLTLGLSFILATMESVYVITGKPIYKEMTQFWGKLFGINFALGVATGLTMEFEFGTNWSMYSHFVGDIFGTPLAIEGLMAFFMESTFVGVMFFGWDRLSARAHLVVTYLVALGSNLSALWILIANGFMQDPRGGTFDPNTMRMQFSSFVDLIFNPDAQAKFVHTSIAGFVTGSMFVMGISAYYLLTNKRKDIALRSFRIATVFGVISSIGVITLGDALGYIDAHAQPTKLAAMEAIWTTDPHPVSAAWNLIAFPSRTAQKNYFEISIPYVLTPLLTHSEDTVIPGIIQLEQEAKPRIENGIKAMVALKAYNEDHGNTEALATFKKYEKDMGYGFLAKEFAPDQDLAKVNSENLPSVLDKTAKATIPNVWVEFWSFRLMVAAGFFMLALFAFAAYYSLKNEVEKHPALLKLALWSIPLPWVAVEFGWITAENGRQPWTVYGWLPTFVSASSHSVGYMIFSLIGFTLLYSSFIAVELYLMFKYARLGPQEHHHHQPEPQTAGGGMAGQPAFAKPSLSPKH